MAPVPVGYSASKVKYNGSPIGYYLRGVKGFQYAIFPVTHGDYEVSYVTDNIPPSVTEIVPTNGQLKVGQNTKVSVTFSEAMNALTINTNTITLRDSLNNPVAATVSYNASDFTAVLTPSGPLAHLTIYTATVKGGAGGVTDATGNPRTNDLIWSFTTANTFFSIWSSTAAPRLVDGGSADSRRLVVAGFSMGGIGAFCLALHSPHRFAALVSVCGACEQPDRLDALAHLPQWIAWAEDDEIARLTEGSQQVVARLQRYGRLIARPYRLGRAGSEGAHVRTADAAFAEAELYRCNCSPGWHFLVAGAGWM
jgi:hypothetical protein